MQLIQVAPSNPSTDSVLCACKRKVKFSHEVYSVISRQRVKSYKFNRNKVSWKKRWLPSANRGDDAVYVRIGYFLTLTNRACLQARLSPKVSVLATFFFFFNCGASLKISWPSAALWKWRSECTSIKPNYARAYRNDACTEWRNSVLAMWRTMVA